MGKPRILVAPLDWGLGHSTRCIPIIRELLQQGAEVLLAGNPIQEALLLAEFPGLPFLPLNGYNIRYAASRSGFMQRMMLQVPKILRTIRAENAWLAQTIREYQIDLVISDNRFGLNHPAVPCIFITHQLRIQSPFGKWSERLLQRWNYKYINKFTECWVPDVENEHNLAGNLSHTRILPHIPIRYVGPLSRFENTIVEERKNHLLVILSGPEPQRTLLENQLIDELVRYNGTADVVRALPGTDRLLPSTNQIRFYNHLSAQELNQKIIEAEFVISRCGYSTVMDLVKLKKKSILIPTPGQTEQEYLSLYLHKQHIAYCTSQEQFSLAKDLQSARDFNYQFPPYKDEVLKNAVIEWLNKLKH